MQLPTLDWSYVIPFLGTLLSPVVAVLVSMWIQNRKERRNNKIWMLSTLIATRHEPLSAESIRALNMIDMVFHDKRRIRQLWREYYEMLGNQGLDNPVGWEQRNKKKIELITEMANALGYGRQISHLDVDRVYYPKALDQQFLFNKELQEELIRVLKTTARFEVVEKNQLAKTD